MPSKDRQREMARKKLERHMAERASKARQRRRIFAGIGAGLTLAVVVAVAIVVVVVSSGNDSPKGGNSPTCAYLDAARGNDKIKNVGKPSTKNVPDKGIYRAAINTNFGKIDLALDRSAAPCSVNSFAYLVSKGFYNNTTCHRLTVSGIYILQCGDPFGDGMGGPSYQYGVENTPTDEHPAYPVGSVALARQPNDPNSNGSQFFIVYKDSPDLTADYSLLGKVSQGLNVITDAIAPNGVKNDTDQPGDGQPAKPVDITTIAPGS